MTEGQALAYFEKPVSISPYALSSEKFKRMDFGGLALTFSKLEGESTYRLLFIIVADEKYPTVQGVRVGSNFFSVLSAYGDSASTITSGERYKIVRCLEVYTYVTKDGAAVEFNFVYARQGIGFQMEPMSKSSPALMKVYEIRIYAPQNCREV
jgi:hypothetical protein